MSSREIKGHTIGGRADEARLARFVVPAVIALGIGLAFATHWAAVAVRVGTGFAAKVACSLHFNSGQDPDAIMRDYIDAELGGAGRLFDLAVDESSVTAHGPLGSHARAIYREGNGCTLLAGISASRVVAVSPVPSRGADGVTRRPGDTVPRGPEVIETAIDTAFSEPEDGERGRLRATKAVVVIYDGRLLAERYAEGYGRQTPMLSWSMAKSVLAAIVGAAVADGKLVVAAPAPVPEWAGAGDPRGAITLDMLLRQSSGLEFDETYGAVNDVSRMLFAHPDTGAYAASKPLRHPPDSFWSYSSGTSNIVARIVSEALGRSPDAFNAFARAKLFGPCQMPSAFFEFDASGTPIGSSFVFMTALDWARFGEIHRVDGVCPGNQRVLPEGWVRYVTTPTSAAPRGNYGAHWWLNAGSPEDPSERAWPSLPTDAYAATGYSGQYVFVVPSAKLVVVRLGLSLPDDGNDGTEELVAALVRAVTPETGPASAEEE